MQHLPTALRHDRTQTDRFFGTLAGTVPIPEFFSPESVGRITEASRTAPAGAVRG